MILIIFNFQAYTIFSSHYLIMAVQIVLLLLLSEFSSITEGR